MRRPELITALLLALFVLASLGACNSGSVEDRDAMTGGTSGNEGDSDGGAGTGGGEAGKAGKGGGSGKGGGGNAGDGSDGGEAGSSGTSDAGPGDVDGGDIEPPPAGSVPVFMVTGKVGRRMLTCDAGDTWQFDVNVNAGAVCYTGGFDCDHQAWANLGVVYGNGMWASAFGWGAAMTGDGFGIYTTVDGDDGAAWSKQLDGADNGIAYGKGVWLSGGSDPGVSADGVTWARLGDPSFSVTRGLFYANTMGGRFVIMQDGPIVRVSDDGAKTFHEPTVPMACGGNRGAGSPSVLVTLRQDTTGCRSTDGGDTWTAITLPAQSSTELIWTGSQFWTWGGGARLSSTDGKTWTSTPMVPSLTLNHVARAADGTLLAARSEFGKFYTEASFFRSTDGIHWEAPAMAAKAKGHPITSIAAGYVPAAACE